MRVKKPHLFILTVAALMLFASAAQAGDGSVVTGPPHLLNLYLYYTYDEADMQVMRDAFQAASQLLYNSTNGQVQIGAVRVSKLATYSSRADIRILQGEGGASANLGGLGVPGLNMNFYRDQHRWTNNDGPDGNERGQFGIVHELGHYAFELYDEYLGGDGSPSCLEDEDSTIACIMDGGTTINNMRTEFCSEEGLGLITDHHPNNTQHDIWGVSCWEHLVDYVLSEYGITVTDPSVADPPDTTMPGGHQDIAWIVVGDTLRYSLSIDKSYSMVGSKMDLTKIAADLFVDLVHESEGEYLGVNAFSDDADTVFAMTEVVDATVKSDARAEIDDIAVENNTAMGDGMRLSLDQITDNGTLPLDDSNIEAVVLLSDGVHNHGSEDPEDVIPDLKARGVRVFTVGLGDPAAAVYPLDEETLEEIADLTGGLYRHAPAEADLPAIYAEYYAEVRGEEVADEATGSWTGSGGEAGAAWERQALVDSYSGEATFVLHWPVPRHYFDLELRDPDGNTVTPAVANSDPKVVYVERANYEYYRVQEPKPGTWTLRVDHEEYDYDERRGEMLMTDSVEFSVESPKGVRFTTQVLASSRLVGVGFDVADFIFDYPEVPVLKVAVVAGPPVAGASVTALITGPGGLVRQVKLHDDGQASHGDVEADDGVYSARFLDFPLSGAYDLRLRVENRNGVEARPDELPPPGWRPQSIAPFTRQTRGRIKVRGVPAELPRPEIESITPRSVKPGQLVQAVIRGAGFVQGAGVHFDHPGVRVETSRFVDSGRLELRLRIADDAVSGPSDVTVVNPGGKRAVASEAFLVAGPYYPWGLSLHAGWSNPTGVFGGAFDADYSLGLDVEYRLSRAWAAELVAGYHSFDGRGGVSDTYLLNLSANLRYRFPTPSWLFVHAGPGIYFPKTGSNEPGYLRGLGVRWDLKPGLLLEGTYDEHIVFTSGPDVTFATTWIGLKARF